jgi:hypothetical protein
VNLFDWLLLLGDWKDFGASILALFDMEGEGGRNELSIKV